MVIVHSIKLFFYKRVIPAGLIGSCYSSKIPLIEGWQTQSDGVDERIDWRFAPLFFSRTERSLSCHPFRIINGMKRDKEKSH